MTEILEETGLQTMPLTEFAEALAATAPTPGDSCTAALPGALAAGLVALVARLTAECDPFTDLAYDMEAVADAADRLRAQLLELVDEDADAFERVMAARRLPTETPEERDARLQVIQRAYKAAVEPPLRVCHRSLRVLELAVELAERGNPHAAADAGVAALLSAASVEAAALIVELELGPVDDEGFRSSCSRDAQAARGEAAALRQAALSAVAGGPKQSASEPEQ
jgi:formiminotetrahydrofolate cyclodeaminase